MISIGNKNLSQAVVEWLQRTVPQEAWAEAGVAAYLKPAFWTTVDYREVDFDPADGSPEFNLRTAGHTTQPGRVLIASNPEDTKILWISALESNQVKEDLHSQALQIFLRLANGSKYEKPVRREDFGTW